MSHQHDHLPRLPAKYYRGQAFVHWTMTTQDRVTGWLVPEFHYQFREVLTHTMFRYGLTCPIYCCMPEHIHLLWIGILDQSDQQRATKFLRRHVNLLLAPFGACFQRQPYDHVLRDEEREPEAFESVAEYIARNAERRGLVPVDAYRDYPYTGCLVPGYPELRLWQGDYWGSFWNTYSFLRKNGLVRGF